MSLATADLLAQFDLVGTREDLSDIVSEILLGDKSLPALDLSRAYRFEALSPGQ